MNSSHPDALTLVLALRRITGVGLGLSALRTGARGLGNAMSRVQGGAQSKATT